MVAWVALCSGFGFAWTFARAAEGGSEETVCESAIALPRENGMALFLSEPSGYESSLVVSFARQRILGKNINNDKLCKQIDDLSNQIIT